MNARPGMAPPANRAPAARVIAGPWPGPMRGRTAENLSELPAPPLVALLPAAEESWVQPVSVLLLALALLWNMFGGGGDNVMTDPTKTADVNPYNSIVWLGLLAASMSVLSQRWREVAALARSLWPLLALYAYFAISVAWALDPQAALRRILEALVQLMLFATLVSGIRRAPMLHVAIVAVCGFVAFADLAFWVINPGVAMAEDGFTGLQPGKNQTGLLLMYGCLAGGPCLAYARHWFLRTSLVITLLVMFALLILTRSTTSQSVTIGAAIMIPLILEIARLPRRTIHAIAALSVLVLISALFGYIAWCALTGADLWAPLNGVTFTDRLGIWQFVVGEIGKRPWFGAGYSSFWSINPLVQPSLKTEEWFSLYAIISEGHQGYLDLLATTGLFGFLGSMYVVFRGIGIAGRALGRTPLAPAAWQSGEMGRPTAIFHFAFLLGFLVHNFTESGLFGSSSLLTILMVISLLDLEKWRMNQAINRLG